MVKKKVNAVSGRASRGTPPLVKWDSVHVTRAQRSQIERTASMMHKQTCIPAAFCKTVIYDGSPVLDSLSTKVFPDSMPNLALLPFHVFLRRLKVTVYLATTPPKRIAPATGIAAKNPQRVSARIRSGKPGPKGSPKPTSKS